MPKLYLCCGLSWRSRWCTLEALTRCKLKAICDRHDAAIQGVPVKAMRQVDRLTAEEIDRELTQAGVKTI